MLFSITDNPIAGAILARAPIAPSWLCVGAAGFMLGWVCYFNRETSKPMGSKSISIPRIELGGLPVSTHTRI